MSMLTPVEVDAACGEAQRTTGEASRTSRYEAPETFEKAVALLAAGTNP
jgi:hypothetical protein